MQPIEFPGSNVVFGKDQPEYKPLPALVIQDSLGSVITCWELTDEEIEELTRTKRLYLKQLTFGNPLQPLLPTVDLSDGIELI